jgi:hypothetical protein
MPKISRPALGPTQPPIQWVTWALSAGIKWPMREADHSPPPSAEVKNEWSCCPSPNWWLNCSHHFGYYTLTPPQTKHISHTLHYLPTDSMPSSLDTERTSTMVITAASYSRVLDSIPDQRLTFLSPFAPFFEATVTVIPQIAEWLLLAKSISNCSRFVLSSDVHCMSETLTASLNNARIKVYENCATSH